MGIELWSMSPNILFDNIIVTDDEGVAEKWIQDTFGERKKLIAQKSVRKFFSPFVRDSSRSFFPPEK